MTEIRKSARREQADRELGRTEVGRGSSGLLSLVLLATLTVVPVWQEIGGRLSGGEVSRPLLGLARMLPEAVSTLTEDGFFAANRVLQREIDRAETALEDESLLRARLLPPVQSLLLGTVGLGNEQVYAGRDGWLFYRADVDHVTGPGFLEPEVLRARVRGGNAWEAPPQPDPLAAMLELRDLLGREGAALLVMPTPVKPSLHPERFSSHRLADASRGVENASYGELLARLTDAGVKVFDPRPALLRARDEGATPVYLNTDTHWSPAAMERVAEELAALLTSDYGLDPGSSVLYESPAVVESRGDLFEMLRLPAGQELVASERVEIRAVLTSTGTSWRPQPGSAVMLLGDSFTNVYSDSRLGWGNAAGLAERLAFHLRRPVDRIALNAGGAHASREALARALESGDRLASVEVVVYQFATRELSSGDWKLLEGSD